MCLIHFILKKKFGINWFNFLMKRKHFLQLFLFSRLINLIFSFFFSHLLGNNYFQLFLESEQLFSAISHLENNNFRLFHIRRAIIIVLIINIWKTVIFSVNLIYTESIWLKYSPITRNPGSNFSSASVSTF